MKQSAVIWPNDYLPGTTDNFASNEIIVAGLSAKEIWAQLNDTTLSAELLQQRRRYPFLRRQRPGAERQRPLPLHHLWLSG